jgi:hypothetical protein
MVLLRVRLIEGLDHGDSFSPGILSGSTSEPESAGEMFGGDLKRADVMAKPSEQAPQTELDGSHHTVPVQCLFGTLRSDRKKCKCKIRKNIFSRISLGF